MNENINKVRGYLDREELLISLQHSGVYPSGLSKPLSYLRIRTDDPL